MSSKVESEVAKKLDLSVLRYSRVWEDHRLLSGALQLTPEDVVLSITSSGDNVLNMLLDGPKKIVAVDMSPAQNAVLELKLAAIKCLVYEDYLLLLGETEDILKQRAKIYQRLKENLPIYAKEYWDSHTDILESGLSSSGRLDKYIATFYSEQLPKRNEINIKLLSSLGTMQEIKRVVEKLNRSFIPLLTVISSEQMDHFFAAKSLDEQNIAFKQFPLDKLEKLTTWYYGRDQLMKTGRSEAQFKYVEASDGSVGAFFTKRFMQICQTVPIWDNYYMSIFMRGQRGYNPASKPALALPYLTRDGFMKLKSLVDRVEVFTGTVEAYISQPSALRISKANLSDIFEYMSEEASDQLFVALADTMGAGGRIAYWTLLVPRTPSPALRERLTLLDELSTELYKQDRVFFYSAFHIVEVKDLFQ